MCIYGWHNNVYYYYTTYYHCTWSDFLIVMKNTIHSGKLNGSIAALGITSAHIIYSSLAWRIIYILTSLYYVFLIIKILGACYLIYLGVQSIRSARQSMNFNTGGIKVNDVSCFTSYRQGFLSTILNPKALLYYVSVYHNFCQLAELK